MKTSDINKLQEIEKAGCKKPKKSGRTDRK